MTSVGDGTTALTQAMSLSPQVVVTDLHVPGLNGLELCRRLKTTEVDRVDPGHRGHGCRPRERRGARACCGLRSRADQAVPARRAARHHPRSACQERARARHVHAGGRALHATSHPHVEPGRAESRHPVPHGSNGGPGRPHCRAPTARSGLAWRDTQTVAGIQFDYFTPCENGCGQYYFDHQRRRFMRLR